MSTRLEHERFYQVELAVLREMAEGVTMSTACKYYDVFYADFRDRWLPLLRRENPGPLLTIIKFIRDSETSSATDISKALGVHINKVRAIQKKLLTRADSLHDRTKRTQNLLLAYENRTQQSQIDSPPVPGSPQIDFLPLSPGHRYDPPPI